jgi:uncharacterized protein YbjT (DUF2867 family)
MRRILVTGATGTVGAEVVRALLASREADPEITVRVATRGAYASQAPIEHVRFDFADASSFAPALEGVDAFFFVSPLSENQVSEAETLLAAAVAAGVRHVVRLSSRATGWDQVCVLRKWHREIEAAIVASGLTSTMLRPCSFMQNILGAPLELALRHGTLSIPLGSGHIPFVDAHDLGEAAARCLLDPGAHAGATYVLTGAEALDGTAITALLADTFGRAVRYVPTPPELARAKGRERGMPVWLVESGLRVYAHAESGEEAAIDPTLGTLLGRRPTGFSTFLGRLPDANRAS